MTDHNLWLGNYNAITVVGNISRGIVQNPTVARLAVVALASAMCVIRRGILHVTTLTRNQLEVRQQRNQLGSDLEHGSCVCIDDQRGDSVR